jgi:hypothetical protein
LFNANHFKKWVEVELSPDDDFARSRRERPEHKRDGDDGKTDGDESIFPVEFHVMMIGWLVAMVGNGQPLCLEFKTGLGICQDGVGWRRFPGFFRFRPKSA